MAPEMAAALNEADKALEKAIPATPNMWGDGYATGDDSGEVCIDSWDCPSCNTTYEITDVHKFCPECGQAIKHNIIQQYLEG